MNSREIPPPPASCRTHLPSDTAASSAQEGEKGGEREAERGGPRLQKTTPTRPREAALGRPGSEGACRRHFSPVFWLSAKCLGYPRVRPPFQIPLPPQGRVRNKSGFFFFAPFPTLSGDVYKPMKNKLPLALLLGYMS